MIHTVLTGSGASRSTVVVAIPGDESRDAVVDGKTAAVAAIGLVLLWRFKVKEPLIVLLGAIAGLLLH